MVTEDKNIKRNSAHFYPFINSDLGETPEFAPFLKDEGPFKET